MTAAPPPPCLLGLTGGIGSGKSTVAALLAERGAAVIDADAISRAATATGGPALPAIARAFGPAMIGADGALDRAAMRALVYADASARQRLEAIIHPLVSQETDRQTQAATQAGARLIVFDVPLLVEAGARWRRRVDRVLVVDCERATQIARVMARNALTEQQVRDILAAQASRAARLAAADAVVFNGAAVSLHALRRQVHDWEQYR
ncbi:MAG: dephospho-CoA kinase [Pseudomonadota bacterium]|nr:dephospho-CoA kinase [Pseudomonadota bacterium]